MGKIRQLLDSTPANSIASDNETDFINKFSGINFLSYSDKNELLKKEFASKKFIFKIASDPQSLNKFINFINSERVPLESIIQIKDIYQMDDNPTPNIDELLQKTKGIYGNFEFAKSKGGRDYTLPSLLKTFPPREAGKLLDQVIANPKISLASFLSVKKQQFALLGPEHINNFIFEKDVLDGDLNYIISGLNRERVRETIKDNNFAQFVSLIDLLIRMLDGTTCSPAARTTAVEFFEDITKLNYTIKQCFSDEVLNLLAPYCNSSKSGRKGLLLDFKHKISTSSQFKNGVLDLESIPLTNEDFVHLVDYLIGKNKQNEITSINLSGTKVDDLPEGLNFKKLVSINMGSQTLKQNSMRPKYAEAKRKELIKEGLNQEGRIKAAVDDFKKFINNDFDGDHTNIIKYGVTKNYPLNVDFFKTINFAKLSDRLKEIEEFAKVATPEEMKKFLDLLECEWANI